MIKSLLSSFPLVFFVIFIHASVIAVESDTLDFDSFVANYGRSYLKGSDEYKIRHQIFQVGDSLCLLWLQYLAWPTMYAGQNDVLPNWVHYLHV